MPGGETSPPSFQHQEPQRQSLWREPQYRVPYWPFSSQAAFYNKSLSLGFVALIQAVSPTVIVAGGVYAAVLAHGLKFNEYFVALALFASLLTVAMLRLQPAGGAAMRAVSVAKQAGFLVVHWLVLIGIVLAAGYLTTFGKEYPWPVIVSWAVITPLVLLGVHLLCDLCFRRIMQSQEVVRSAIIAGVNEPGETLADRLSTYPEIGFRLKGFCDDRGRERLGQTGDFPLVGKLSEVSDFVRRNNIDVVFIALPMRHVQRVMEMVDALRDSTVSIYYVPDLFVCDLIQSRTGEIMGVPVISMRETPFVGYRGVMKRITDLILTLGVLVPALPVMGVIALAIKLTTGSPVIFKQFRYGLDGRQITVYKFRSMYVTENGEKIVQATREDPRITPLGGFLRKTSLDELPQLFNVLQGHMSLVGPRPHAVAHNEEYRVRIKGYMIRHKVLPGITGLAQVNGCRGETSDLAAMEARVHHDLEYLKNWTPLLDLKILLMTGVAVFRRGQAY